MYQSMHPHLDRVSFGLLDMVVLIRNVDYAGIDDPLLWHGDALLRFPTKKPRNTGCHRHTLLSFEELRM